MTKAVQEKKRMVETAAAMLQPPWKTLLWRQALDALLVFSASFALAGLVFFKTEMAASARQVFSSFEWLVLVNGNQLEIDEVGRYLRQQDGVKEVSFVSPDDTLARIKNDPTWAEDIGILGSNPFPPAWRVSWFPERMSLDRLKDAEADVRSFPHVTDVAFDQRVLEQVHRFRHRWHQAELVLAVLLVTLAVFVAVLIGRFLFFGMRGPVSPKDFGILVARDAVAWAAGFLLFTVVLGPLPWLFLAGGLAIAVFRELWMRARL